MSTLHPDSASAAPALLLQRRQFGGLLGALLLGTTLGASLDVVAGEPDPHAGHTGHAGHGGHDGHDGHGSPAAAVAPAPLPGDSLYQLKLSLTDQRGSRFALASLQGRPQLVSMFYSGCQYVCPMLVEAARATEAALSPAEREALGVTLVSLDPPVDTVAVLAEMARQRGVADNPRWHLARLEQDGEVRRLAAALGIRYRALPEGGFNHSALLVLLDAQGRPVASSSRLAGADPTLVAAIRQTLAQASHQAH